MLDNNKYTIYAPGEEPEEIKKLLSIFFSSVKKLFPDRRIRTSKVKRYGKLKEATVLLYDLLGYDSEKEFFEAYGFQMVSDEDPDIEGAFEQNNPEDSVIELLSEPNQIDLKEKTSENTDDNENETDLSTLFYDSRRRNCSSDSAGVPIWEKYTLTIQEAAEYFRIGENKLRDIVKENKNASFVLWNGNRPQIKRRIFEDYIDKLNEI